MFIGSALGHHPLAQMQGSVENINGLTCGGSLESLTSDPPKCRHHVEQVDISERAEADRICHERVLDVVMHLRVLSSAYSSWLKAWRCGFAGPCRPGNSQHG